MVRNFISREANVLKIYTILIKPHKEYCNQAWAPLLRQRNWSIILRLEGLQRSDKTNKKSKRVQFQEKIGEIDINYFIGKENER